MKYDLGGRFHREDFPQDKLVPLHFITYLVVQETKDISKELPHDAERLRREKKLR